jgi:hypothetical protein
MKDISSKVPENIGHLQALPEANPQSAEQLQVVMTPHREMNSMDLCPKFADNSSNVIRILIKCREVWKSTGSRGIFSWEMGKVHLHPTRQSQYKFLY